MATTDHDSGFEPIGVHPFRAHWRLVILLFPLIGLLIGGLILTALLVLVDNLAATIVGILLAVALPLLAPLLGFVVALWFFPRAWVDIDGGRISLRGKVYPFELVDRVDWEEHIRGRDRIDLDLRIGVRGGRSVAVTVERKRTPLRRSDLERLVAVVLRVGADDGVRQQVFDRLRRIAAERDRA